MKYKFYDTCSLLKALDHIWEDDSRVVISSITLQELENIKTSNTKDPETKFAARRVVNELDSRFGQYDVFIWNNSNARSNTINDNKILLSVLEFQKALNEDDELIFVTNDICCKHLARAMFTDIKIVSFSEEIYDYDGYKEVYLDMDGMNEFYSNQDINLYNLLINQYLLIYDKETRECVDRLCWCKQDGVEGYRRVNFVNFNSHWFGDIKPMKGDDYQMLAADSLTHNKISMIKGKAGTGKTFLSLAYLLHKLERHQIDRIIVFCNTVATKNSAKLGLI